MAIRVLLLTQWFDPEPTFKGLVFAKELVRQGFEVEVLTGFPNYPGGKVYPGYTIKLLQREVIDGVQVTRVPLYPNHGQSAIKRVLNYASFAASSLIYGLFVAKRADVIYAYHPPLTVGITASLIRKFRRIPVVYDIQDMWPDTLRATGMINNARVLNMVEAVCQWVYRRVDHMVVLSPRLALLDETDSGLDIDALRIVAEGVNKLRTKENAVILVTHYQRLLDYIKPDFVHVLSNGKIIQTGDASLALELEKKGYDWLT